MHFNKFLFVLLLLLSLLFDSCMFIIHPLLLFPLGGHALEAGIFGRLLLKAEMQELDSVGVFLHKSSGKVEN